MVYAVSVILIMCATSQNRDIVFFYMFLFQKNMTLQEAEDLVSPFEEQSVIILILFKLCIIYVTLDHKTSLKSLAKAKAKNILYRSKL